MVSKARARRTSRPHRDDNAIYAQIPTRRLTALAQDPGFRVNGRVITTTIEVPAERLAPGPAGHRIRIIDYDDSNAVRYRPLVINPRDDPFESKAESSPNSLLENPQFHQQHVYAIAMSTLWLFERALGRHLHWAFGSHAHRLNIAPHAFVDTNAFYSRKAEGVFFGYFRDGQEQPIFSCLARDVVVHEISHACLDGLRSFLTRPSSPEQRAFHEGFSDLVAILSLFRSQQLVELLLQKRKGKRPSGSPLMQPDEVTIEALKYSALFCLAEQMGGALSGVRGHALRRSILHRPDPHLFDNIERVYQSSSHDLGEVLVAAFLNAFVAIWHKRLERLVLHDLPGTPVSRYLVAAEGCQVAGQLLRMAIRAIDYMPPVDVRFRDYLSALLTADEELYADDTRFEYRKILLKHFHDFGINPVGKDGVWERPRFDYTHTGTHFEAMQRDPDAVFRFIWENWDALELHPDAFTRVISVRPCMRVGPDGFVLRETVAEYVQTLDVLPRELKRLEIGCPKGVDRQSKIRLYGSGVLIFDEYGRVKYHVGHGVKNRRKHGLQAHRLQYLADRDQLASRGSQGLEDTHRLRAQGSAPLVGDLRKAMR